MSENTKIYSISGDRAWMREDGILHIEAQGDVELEKFEKCMAVVDELSSSLERPLDLLVDINKAGKPAARTRREMLKLLESEKVRRVAYFGLHPVARILASFTVGSTRSGRTKFFSNIDEALAWLKRSD